MNDYSYYVSNYDYSKIAHVIEALIIKNNSILDWDVLEELVLLLLKHFTSDKKEKGDDDNILTSLWNTCVR